MNSVGLIGFGRFGKVLANILRKGFAIRAYDPAPQDTFPGVEHDPLNRVLEERTIFVAVPIRSFETVIRDIAPMLSPGTTLIDVCSVKIHPVEVMTRCLRENTGIIATHPLFGPDSFASAHRLTMMMNPSRDVHGQFEFWRTFFAGQGIKVIEMDPDTHDRLAASTQGVTHLLGRTLRAYGIRQTDIGTEGFRDLLDLVNQTCNDTLELYTDLQSFNPYTQEMIVNLRTALDEITDTLEQEMTAHEILEA